MRKAEKILEAYKLDMQETTEQCIRKILQSIHDEISLTLGDSTKLVLERTEYCEIFSEALTEEALCEHIAEQLIVLKDLFKVKESVFKN